MIIFAGFDAVHNPNDFLVPIYVSSQSFLYDLLDSAAKARTP